MKSTFLLEAIVALLRGLKLYAARWGSSAPVGAGTALLAGFDPEIASGKRTRGLVHFANTSSATAN